jgi:hypothetical protein
VVWVSGYQLVDRESGALPRPRRGTRRGAGLIVVNVAGRGAPPREALADEDAVAPGAR